MICRNKFFMPINDLKRDIGILKISLCMENIHMKYEHINSSGLAI